MHKISLVLIILSIAVGCSKNDSNISTIKEDFDPTYKIYGSVLEKHVTSEQIDYLKLKENREELDHFIYQLAGTTKKQLKNMSQNEQFAYWINAYNGITLRSIIDNYPVNSIQNIKGVWTEKKWLVAGQEVTLDFIEHQLLRPTFRDPRVHFAVNCASIGCPPLFNKPFIGNTIDSSLDIVSARFVQNRSRHTIDYENHSILTTELFSWFWKDFVGKYNDVEFNNVNDIDGAILNFTFRHLNDSLKTKLSKEANWKISFAPYDWSLNDTKR